eukprot:scaffold107806_cov38-Tisochrysis_lutea.AAC.3
MPNAWRMKRRRGLSWNERSCSCPIHHAPSPSAFSAQFSVKIDLAAAARRQPLCRASPHTPVPPDLERWISMS